MNSNSTQGVISMSGTQNLHPYGFISAKSGVCGKSIFEILWRKYTEHRTFMKFSKSSKMSNFQNRRRACKWTQTRPRGSFRCQKPKSCIHIVSEEKNQLFMENRYLRFCEENTQSTEHSWNSQNHQKCQIFKIDVGPANELKLDPGGHFDVRNPKVASISCQKRKISCLWKIDIWDFVKKIHREPNIHEIKIKYSYSKFYIHWKYLPWCISLIHCISYQMHIVHFIFSKTKYWLFYIHIEISIIKLVDYSLDI